MKTNVVTRAVGKPPGYEKDKRGCLSTTFINKNN